MPEKILTVEEHNNGNYSLLNNILIKIKEKTSEAMTMPANIASLGSSPRDLYPLINAVKKKEILAILQDVELVNKIHLLSEIDISTSDNSFDKKEMPYIGRFTVYSILEELFERGWNVVTTGAKEGTPISVFEHMDNIFHDIGLEVKDIVLLRELINKNESHYLKHFGSEYQAKLKLLKKVLKNYQQ